MTESDIDACAGAVRAFNRFHTAHVGALNEHLLDSPFGLTEARVLYELGQESGLSASGLAASLRLDPAYLSRILGRFGQRGLLERASNPRDRRGSVLTLTEEGRAAAAALDRASQGSVARIVRPLAPADRTALLQAMETIRGLLGGDRGHDTRAVVIRAQRMGEVSWVAHRHATLYRDAYGWDGRFETMVTQVAADFLKSHDGACEQCWVAERGGAILGSVTLVRADERVAKLRLLYVEPAARGLGLGRRLVEHCLAFARAAGYRRITLWTNDCLTEACALYQSLGFALVSEHPHSDFGPPMVGQVLERDL